MRFPYPKIKQLRTLEQFEARRAELGLELPIDAALSPEHRLVDGSQHEISGRQALAAPMTVRDASAGELLVGNRFTILPMEGWDADTRGAPTDLVSRRWLRFAESGAKLIWGEATAICPEGRANPNQLVIDAATVTPLAELLRQARKAHRAKFGSDEDLVVGLQLTHSGRWARPGQESRPRIARRHRLLDRRLGLDDDNAARALLSDVELSGLVERFVEAARLAQRAGFQFVDVKHCHGYLLHELLSARQRPGRYGGPLDHRTRFLREVVDGIRERAPGLAIAVRLSAFDFVPFAAQANEVGAPDPERESGSNERPFGGDSTGVGVDLEEPSRFLDQIESLGVGLVSVTAGSPYYCPHIQRPAQYPPSDGYQPPEDPLSGVSRLLTAAAALKRRHPSLAIVGSGYSYLQEWLPAIAAGAVVEGWTDSVGLGRVALSYPRLPADVLAGREIDFKLYCRTFSDCTTAPRNGLISGCYPLDDFYKKRPERARLREIKSGSTDEV